MPGLFFSPTAPPLLLRALSLSLVLGRDALFRLAVLVVVWTVLFFTPNPSKQQKTRRRCRGAKINSKRPATTSPATARTIPTATQSRKNNTHNNQQEPTGNERERETYRERERDPSNLENVEKDHPRSNASKNVGSPGFVAVHTSQGFYGTAVLSSNAAAV